MVYSVSSKAPQFPALSFMNRQFGPSAKGVRIPGKNFVTIHLSSYTGYTNYRIGLDQTIISLQHSG